MHLPGQVTSAMPHTPFHCFPQHGVQASVGRIVLQSLERSTRGEMKLSIREMRAQLGKLEEILAREPEVVITKRGVPIARLVGIPRRERPDHADLRGRLPHMARSSADLVRSDRDAR